MPSQTGCVQYASGGYQCIFIHIVDCRMIGVHAAINDLHR